MNGTGDGNDNKGEIKVIVRTIAFLAGLCVFAVCLLAYCGKQIPPELNTLTGGLAGSLISMLAKTTPSASTTIPPIKTAGESAGEITVPKQTLETTKTT